MVFVFVSHSQINSNSINILKVYQLVLCLYIFVT